MASAADCFLREEDLESLSAEWDSLASAHDRSNVFLKPSWLRLWCHTLRDPRPLHVFAVRGDAGLLAVAAFLADGQRLTLAGDPEVWDYADVTVRSGYEDAAYETLLAGLQQQGWQEVRLWGLAESSPAYQLLPGVARRLDLSVTLESEAVCPVVSLPSTWDEYLASLEKKHRHELRRKMRRFEESGGEGSIVVLRDAEQIRDAFPDFLRLLKESREDKAAFMTPEREHFFRHIAEDLTHDDQVRLYLLERDQTRLAAILCFDGDTSLMMYNSGYDPQYANVSVGLVSKAMLLKSAIDDGKRRVDFLRGSERYKYELGARDETVSCCTIQLR